MAITVYAKEKKQIKQSGTDNVYVAHGVQRLYNKSAPMLVLEALMFVVLGILILINPLGWWSAISFVFGCVLVFIGVYRTVAGFIGSHEYGGGWLDVLAGLVGIIIGVLFLVYPLGSAVGLVYLFVVLFCFVAIRALMFAINMARVRFGRYVLNLIMSIFFVVLSVLLLFFPVVGMATVAIYVAIMLIMYSFADLYMFFELRKLKRQVIG